MEEDKNNISRSDTVGGEKDQGLSKILNIMNVLIIFLSALTYYLMLEAYFYEFRPISLSIFALFIGVLAIFESKWSDNPSVNRKSIRVMIISIIFLGNYLLNWGNSIDSYLMSLIWLGLSYNISYNIGYWSRDISWSQEISEQDLDYYRRLTVIGFRNLRFQFVKLSSLIVLIWILRYEIDLSIILLGALVFLLQFVFLGIAFYQKKRTYWVSYGYKVDSNLLKSILIGIVAIVLIVGVIGFIIPTQYNLLPFQSIRAGISRLGQGVELGNRDYDFSVEEIEERGNLNINTEGVDDDDGELSLGKSIFVGAIILGTIGATIFSILVALYIFKHGLDSFIQGIKFTLKKWPQVSLDIIKRFFFRLKALLSAVKNKQESIKEAKVNSKESKGYSFKKDKKYKEDKNRKEVVKTFYQLLDYLAKKGVTKTKEETIGEFFSKVKAKLTLDKEALSLRDIFEFAFYDDDEIDEGEVIKAQEIVDELLNSSG
ncbi:hypothetical protein [Halonatronum saccharophilum]|uniref:hypothetical protein n=1 Tax=Halonatronum saccharophilum TaxID=150060 RepID=UPI0012EB0CDA|nr:hypothetical protein [Halonatronum saccharophilum]